MVDPATLNQTNLEVNVGKQTPGPYELPNHAAGIVLRLIDPIPKKIRNLTGDNSFTSTDLVNTLFENNRTTYFDSIKNIRESCQFNTLTQEIEKSILHYLEFKRIIL